MPGPPRGSWRHVLVALALAAAWPAMAGADEKPEHRVLSLSSSHGPEEQES